jgi:O-succinylbenzoic acid--CoA ligase
MKTENWLTRSAATTPDRVALVDGDDRLTLVGLERASCAFARQLATLGARRGARVALVLEPSARTVVLLHAVTKLGAVAVPLDPRLPDDELERRLAAVGASVVVRDPGEVEQAREADVVLERAIDLDAVHCVIHTSGTSGGAKPVELTYANHLWSAFGSAVRIGVEADDRWLCCLPLHHVGGLAIVLRSAIYGTAVVIERFEPVRVAEVIARERVTLASLVGTTLARLVAAGAELDRLRCALLGGGPVDAGVIERALAAGAPLAPTYGLTEAASQVTTLPPAQARLRPGSAGTPLLPTELRIDDGTILVRGPTVAPGAAGPDGWLRTGDLGRLDEDGHLYVLGRADAVIVTGGENVSPEAVERVLLDHPAVADAAVNASADPEWQQAVVATVVARDDARPSAEELRRFCRERLAPFEVPKRFLFADSLPRDAQGKLRRGELE